MVVFVVPTAFITTHRNSKFLLSIMTNAQANERSLKVVLFYRYKLCMNSRILIKSLRRYRRYVY